MTTLRNDAPDDVPEFRFGTNNFCLVYALHPTKKAFSRVQPRYMPKTRSDWFIVGRCDADWGFCEHQGRDSLELMLLWAREYYRVGMKEWIIRSAEPKNLLHSPMTVHEKKYAAMSKRLQHLLEYFGNISRFMPDD